MLKFALAGNPNCGKTTLFNALTGSTAHVGNWPGVTVDKREGTYKKGSQPVDIVDLPGIYSLSPYTPEEVVARNFVLDERPDCIINIVDATNLERNLYLTTQLMEVDLPLIVALNMTDVLEKQGDKIDVKALEKAIGVPVVEISALHDKNTDQLMKRAIDTAVKGVGRQGSTVLDSSVCNLSDVIGYAEGVLKNENVSAPLFHGVKLVEKDELEVKNHPKEAAAVAKYLEEQGLSEGDAEAEIADARYKYISANFSPTLKRNSKNKKAGETKSDKADRVLTNKWAGIPIFILILAAIFHLTFSEDFLFLGAIFKLPSLKSLGLMIEEEGELVAKNFGASLLSCVYDGAVYSPGVILTNLLGLLLDGIGGAVGGWLASAPAWVGGFVVDGVLGGLFAVLGFLPQILTLFLFFSILEDSGYMARIAFILDRIFRKFGLSGRAFMPMIMGFGCSLPAMINTRTLSDKNERTSTVRVIPFFSCGAKLPILTAIAGAVCYQLGSSHADFITLGMYLLGMVTAIVAVILMRSTTMRGEVPPFIMELPTYHAPRFKSLMIHLWDKTKHFVKKAFTIILASTILVWFLSHFDWGWHYLEDEAMNESILASLGMLLQPIFTPLGFGSQLKTYGWVFAVAAINGLIAKENVIGTFGTIATCLGLTLLVGDFADGVPEAIAMAQATGITIPAMIAFIAFNMTTIPCFAACATAKAELPEGKFKWTLLFWVCTSYIVAAAVYTVGTWWWALFAWLAAAALVIVGIVLFNKKRDKKMKENV